MHQKVVEKWSKISLHQEWRSCNTTRNVKPNRRWTYAIAKKHNVWANTRRFFHEDFWFFSWIYSIFNTQRIHNHFWKTCETKNPIEETNPGDLYGDLLPYIALRNTLSNKDLVQIWNFRDCVYMNITPIQQLQARQYRDIPNPETSHDTIN